MRSAKGIKLLLKVVLIILFIGGFYVPAGTKAEENKKSDVVSNEEKVVYLTFDDGPIPGVTEKVLDVLNMNGVKATFFVVGKEIHEREYLLKRIYKEGHGIGLHTYSHKFSSVYKNDEAFIDEMDKTKELVENIIGYKAKAIRFPGGSDRMLSGELLYKLHNKGYLVYDWNADLGDGINGGASVSTILKKSQKIKGDKNRVFILAHCNSNNINTCRALPYVIKKYKDAGYCFKAIDKNTKEYYYKFKKRKGKD